MIERRSKANSRALKLVADIQPLTDTLTAKLVAVGGKQNGVDAGEPVAAPVSAARESVLDR